MNLLASRLKKSIRWLNVVILTIIIVFELLPGSEAITYERSFSAFTSSFFLISNDFMISNVNPKRFLGNCS